MGGGSVEGSQQANGNVAFNPTSIGGGNISVGGSVGQAGVIQNQNGQAGGAGVSVGLEMSMPGMGLNLQNLKQIKKMYLQNMQAQSSYVPFGPSANEGWTTDIGDSITDTANIMQMGYNGYASAQPAIDALWAMMDPKGHAQNADTVFNTVNALGDVGNAAVGGWGGVANAGQYIAGRPPLPGTGAAQQQQAQQPAQQQAQWQQVDERYFYWEPTQQYWDSQYQLYFDPASQMFYDDQGNQWTQQETDEWFAQEAALQNLKTRQLQNLKTRQLQNLYDDLDGPVNYVDGSVIVGDDGDYITLEVECDIGIPEGHVRMAIKSDSDWWKAINQFNEDGSKFQNELVAIQDKGGEKKQVDVPIGNLDSHTYVLAKAKMLGVHTDMYRLPNTKTDLQEGCAYTFNWHNA